MDRLAGSLEGLSSSCGSLSAIGLHRDSRKHPPLIVEARGRERSKNAGFELSKRGG